MTTGNYRVTVSLGSGAEVHAWDITDQEPAAYGPTDGLSMTRSVPLEQPWPWQPDPATATFGLIVADPADVPGLTLGAPVSIALYMPRDAATPAERFDGRVSDLSFAPHKLGARYQVTCTDYLAELAEVFIGEGNRPAESAFTRFEAWKPPYSFGVTAWFDPPGPPPGSYLIEHDGWEDYPLGFDPVVDPLLPARSGERVSMLAALTDLLNAGPVDQVPIPARWVLAPMLSGTGVAAPRTLDAWYNHKVYRQVSAANVPGSFGLTAPGLYGVVVAAPASTSSQAIDAGEVDFEASWNLRKDAAPSRVEIGGGWGATPAMAGISQTPPVTWRLDTDITDLASGQALADLYAPGPAGSVGWVMDAFTWRLAEAPIQALPALGGLVVLTSIPDGWSPDGRPWYAGLVGSITVAVNARIPTAVVSLMSPSGRVDSAGSLTWNELGASHPAVTWNQLNPTDSWDDYTLIQ